MSTEAAQTGRRGFQSVKVSEGEGEEDALSSVDADQLSLPLLRLLQAGGDGVRPRRNLNEEVFIR